MSMVLLVPFEGGKVIICRRDRGLLVINFFVLAVLIGFSMQFKCLVVIVSRPRFLLWHVLLVHIRYFLVRLSSVILAVKLMIKLRMVVGGVLVFISFASFLLSVLMVMDTGLTSVKSYSLLETLWLNYSLVVVVLHIVIIMIGRLIMIIIGTGHGVVFVNSRWDTFNPLLLLSSYRLTVLVFNVVWVPLTSIFTITGIL